MCVEEAGGGGLVDHLLKVQELLAQPQDASKQAVVTKLGNKVTALGSVPTAIYAFLKALQPIEGIEVINKKSFFVCFTSQIFILLYCIYAVTSFSVVVIV